MRRQMTVVYGLGVQMKFSTTRQLSTARDLSIRDGTTGWGVHDVGAKSGCPSGRIWSCFTPGNGVFGALVTR